MDKFSVSVTPAADKPYHAKRPHRKSRAGCRNCKKRKVKCDEGRPTCRPCTVRKETCVYLAVTKRASPTTRSASSSPGKESSPPLTVARKNPPTTPSVSNQPLFMPSGHDELDMRLLWFYTTATYASFSTGSLKQRNVDVVLKVNVVQHAFANPFLMDCILGLSAMHINHLGIHTMGISRAHEIHYRARAFETYRKAVEAADPTTYSALLATSLLLCGLSTHVFRGPDAAPLSILDWLALWKGIGAIIEAIQLPQVPRSGIAALVFRPSVDLAASARHLPSYLLFMITSTPPTDPDYPLTQTYYKTLQYLGSLYRELAQHGLSQMLLLRIITLPTFLPKPYIDAARAKQPRARVILAHYLVFLKFRVPTIWWTDGISDHEIPHIQRLLGAAWAAQLRTPVAALRLDDGEDLARLLLGDPAWSSATTMADEPEPVAAMPSGRERELAIRAAREEDVSAEVEEYRREQIRFRKCE
jgi:hypothetical protein